MISSYNAYLAYKVSVFYFFYAFVLSNYLPVLHIYSLCLVISHTFFALLFGATHKNTCWISVISQCYKLDTRDSLFFSLDFRVDAPDSCFNDWFIVSIFGENRIKEAAAEKMDTLFTWFVSLSTIHKTHISVCCTRDRKQWNSRTMKVSLRKIVNTAAAAGVVLVKFLSMHEKKRQRERMK